MGFGWCPGPVDCENAGAKTQVCSTLGRDVSFVGAFSTESMVYYEGYWRWDGSGGAFLVEGGGWGECVGWRLVMSGKCKKRTCP